MLCEGRYCAGLQVRITVYYGLGCTDLTNKTESNFVNEGADRSKINCDTGRGLSQFRKPNTAWNMNQTYSKKPRSLPLWND
jgi:hypothetical protein